MHGSVLFGTQNDVMKCVSFLSGSAKKIWRCGKTFVLAHKIPCACAVVGLFCGWVGFCVCCATGIFAELIVRRLRDEKTESHFAKSVSDRQEDDLFAAYKTLGLTSEATQEEIKSAHRRLAAQYHPDSAGGNPERFLQIQQAYELLSVRK